MPTKRRLGSRKKASLKTRKSVSAKGSFGARRRTSRKGGRSRKGRRSHKGRRSGHKSGAKSKTNVVSDKNIGGSLFADKNRVKLEWHDQNSFTQLASSITYYTAAMNSIYDCGEGFAATNASGYARYYTYYTRSLVRASRIKVRFWADVTGASDAEPVQCIIVPCTTPQKTQILAMTDWNAFKNLPHAKLVTYIPGIGGSINTHYLHAQTLFTGTDSQPLEANFDYTGVTGSNPANLAHWLILFSGMAGSTSQNWQYDIGVEYYVEFFQPIMLTSQSMQTVEGNDFGGTAEEYKAYQAAHACQLVPLAALNEKKEVKEETKSLLSGLHLSKAPPKTPAGYVLVKKT